MKATIFALKIYLFPLILFFLSTAQQQQLKNLKLKHSSLVLVRNLPRLEASVKECTTPLSNIFGFLWLLLLLLLLLWLMALAPHVKRQQQHQQQQQQQLRQKCPHSKRGGPTPKVKAAKRSGTKTTTKVKRRRRRLIGNPQST